MIYIDKNSSLSLYEQIYNCIKKDITDGSIGYNEKLPPIRTLANELSVSKNTVEHAYQQLFVEGYVDSVQGSGYIVCDIQPYFEPIDASPSPLKIELENNSNSLKDIKYDFQYGNISEHSFSIGKWKKSVDEVNSSLLIKQMSFYNLPKGEISLRAEIKRYLKKARGIECDLEQIIICNGLQSSLSMICELLSHDYKNIGFEEPGYNGARIIFKKHNCTIYPIPVQHKKTEWILKNAPYKTVYITPSHQFPLGFVMPIKERLSLLNWASSNDCYIIEDDYDSELRYHSNPIPSLFSIDKSDRTIYIGTFSKAFSPAIRMNYVVLPRHLIHSFSEYKANIYSTVSWFDQQVMANYLHNGFFEKQLRILRKENMMKHDVLIECLNNYFNSHIKILGANAGLHVVIQIDFSAKQDELLKKAQNNSVNIYSINEHYIAPTRDSEKYFLIGFSQLEVPEIEAGIKCLFEAWQNYL